MVLFNHARQPQGLYSAVETGITFFSLPSVIFTFLPPSLAKPGTGAGAGGGRLNVYDAIKSSVVHAATFRARQGSGPLLGSWSFVAMRQRDIVVFILANPVDYCANIQTLHPRISGAIVEQTKIGSIPRQRVGQSESPRCEFARDTKSFGVGKGLKLGPGKPGAVDR